MAEEPANFDDLQPDDLLFLPIPRPRRKEIKQQHRQHRWAPYPRRQHTSYQMQLTFLNAAVVEGLVELVMPPGGLRRDALAVFLEIPGHQRVPQARVLIRVYNRILNLSRALIRAIFGH